MGPCLFVFRCALWSAGAQLAERIKIETALREYKWNRSRAAERLGVSCKTLLSRMRTLGLEN
ncbi:MAG: hypothetical protein HYR58_07900 [Acidobacteria bacterium]|nr:hypothetical protein [Acidobacteriota bacterium]